MQSFGLKGDRVARFLGRKTPENEAKVAILEHFNYFLEKLFMKNTIKSENLIYIVNINFSCFYFKKLLLRNVIKSKNRPYGGFRGAEGAAKMF